MRPLLRLQLTTSTSPATNISPTTYTIPTFIATLYAGVKKKQGEVVYETDQIDVMVHLAIPSNPTNLLTLYLLPLPPFSFPTSHIILTISATPTSPTVGACTR